MYGFETFFPKRVNTKFVVKNIAPGNKCIKLFMYPINNGGTRDLLMIPTVSEADIRHSLLKGSLLIKILAGEIEVVDSNIDILQFEPQQRQFLWDAGIRIGLDCGGSGDGYQFTEEEYNTLIQIINLADGDGYGEGVYASSWKYTLPEGDPFPTQIIWYDSAVEPRKKITEKTITYDDQKRIILEDHVAYSTDGITVIAHYTDTMTYLGPFESMRHRVMV